MVMESLDQFANPKLPTYHSADHDDLCSYSFHKRQVLEQSEVEDEQIKCQ